jgi:hypothetical protein
LAAEEPAALRRHIAAYVPETGDRGKGADREIGRQGDREIGRWRGEELQLRVGNTFLAAAWRGRPGTAGDTFVDDRRVLHEVEGRAEELGTRGEWHDSQDT